nr:dexamethasone-induced protein isoform X1 [Pelodiscus sinensis]|eukprot:XP_025039176.1 dexamethasone-induced protein isoform X1 [Pelodiscus sinensis]
MTAIVLSNNRSQSHPFEVKTGTKQGCIIAPALFCIFIAKTFHLIDGKLPDSMKIVYRMNGKLLKLRRLKAKSKTSTTSIMELQYTDDNMATAVSLLALQTILRAFAEAYENLGLTPIIKKTKVLHQPLPTGQSHVPSINVNRELLENMAHFP